MEIDMKTNVLFRLSDMCYKGEKISIKSSDNIELLAGQLLINRILGVAYNNLNLSSLHPEIRKCFDSMNTNLKTKHEIFKCNLNYLTKILQDFPHNYALLKGAYLSSFIYEGGQRTSNDIDILIEDKNISQLQDLFKSHGFIQGRYDRISNTIIPASRMQIIESRLNFGETIPLLKMIDGKPFEIDINFSVDYKPELDGNLVSELLSRKKVVTIDGYNFNTLETVDFLIHLCCHLYKEATTYDWVLSRRDLLLYKFCDINVFVNKFATESFFINLLERIVEFGVEKECFYTFKNSSIIYPSLNDIEGFVSLKNAVKPLDLEFMSQIIYPRERKIFSYDMSFTDWFFCSDRASQLSEVDNK